MSIAVSSRRRKREGWRSISSRTACCAASTRRGVAPTVPWLRYAIVGSSAQCASIAWPNGFERGSRAVDPAGTTADGGSMRFSIGLGWGHGRRRFAYDRAAPSPSRNSFPPVSLRVNGAAPGGAGRRGLLLAGLLLGLCLLLRRLRRSLPLDPHEHPDPALEPESVLRGHRDPDAAGGCTERNPVAGPPDVRGRVVREGLLAADPVPEEHLDSIR